MGVLTLVTSDTWKNNPKERADGAKSTPPRARLPTMNAEVNHLVWGLNTQLPHLAGGLLRVCYLWSMLIHPFACQGRQTSLIRADSPLKNPPKTDRVRISIPPSDQDRDPGVSSSSLVVPEMCCSQCRCFSRHLGSC